MTEPEITPQPPPRRRRRVVRPAIYVAVIGLAAWLISQFGHPGGLGGNGSNSPPASDLQPAPQSQPTPAVPAETVKVTIRDYNYLMDNRIVPLADILTAARSAANAGINPSVEIIIVSDYSVMLRSDLEAALSKESIPYKVSESHSATQP